MADGSTGERDALSLPLPGTPRDILSFIDLRVGRTRQMKANAGREANALFTVRLTPLPRSPESVVMDAVAVDGRVTLYTQALPSL
ncbi:hypothetical protein ACO22_05278 [Paracoccidioides brasiliensis]|uniref:Uncharacterized protein n=1 Tax=Paracoccidioides brasiliensis TaxID=121759 RepID=A0A1D2JAR1_PARBR|nr:hypothetical protein ACO22_05278 [Paracoccidioides brasiliensis]